MGGHDELSFTGKRWLWPEVMAPPESPAFMSALLTRRGIVGEAVASYLAPSLAALADPAQMADMSKAVGRLLGALARRESIVVYGDYDVDGVCATALLVDFLAKVGAQVSFYVPHRRSEGYGLNGEAVRELAGRHQLLITVDCGVTAVEEISLARSLGLDVLVVDHHQVPNELPPAVACLDPHRPDCAFPFKGLCATGVAFMLAAAVRRALREQGGFAGSREPDLRELLDLVAIATVADMVPLTGANRTLVTAGLRLMGAAKRPGVRALMEVAKIEPALVSASDLAFRIAPRINARGRMAHAAEAVDLLLTPDAARAKMLAGLLDAANRDRRAVERATLDAAVAAVEAQELAAHAGLVVFDPAWHPGVLGLVATRLVSRYHRPAIVIGEGGRGSGRSIEGLNLHAAISAASAHLLRFGGHPAAAGVTIAPERVPDFRAAFAAGVRQTLGDPPFTPVLKPEAEIDAAALKLDTLAAIEQLAPFGQDNPEPLFVARALAVRGKQVVADEHLKIKLGEGHDAIGFGMAALLPQLPPTVDAVFRLSRNRFRGRETLQLRLEDLRPSA